MVGHDCGLPDPPDSDDSLTTNTEIVMMNDSESDDDMNEYSGYEPLPFEVEDHDHIISEIVTAEDPEEAPDSTFPTLIRAEDTLMQELWSTATPNVVDIKMDKDHEEEVKRAMLNVTLPASSIPEWANAVPEEEWKDHLMHLLQSTKKSDLNDAA